MGHGWIVGVLDDLRTYAELNGLDRVARAIEAATVAAEEDTAPRLDPAGAADGAWEDRSGPGPHARPDREVAQPR